MNKRLQILLAMAVFSIPASLLPILIPDTLGARLYVGITCLIFIVSYFLFQKKKLLVNLNKLDFFCAHSFNIIGLGFLPSTSKMGLIFIASGILLIPIGIFLLVVFILKIYGFISVGE